MLVRLVDLHHLYRIKSHHISPILRAQQSTDLVTDLSPTNETYCIDTGTCTLLAQTIPCRATKRSVPLLVHRVLRRRETRNKKKSTPPLVGIVTGRVYKATVGDTFLVAHTRAPPHSCPVVKRDLFRAAGTSASCRCRVTVAVVVVIMKQPRQWMISFQPTGRVVVVGFLFRQRQGCDAAPFQK